MHSVDVGDWSARSWSSYSAIMPSRREDTIYASIHKESLVQRKDGTSPHESNDIPMRTILIAWRVRNFA